MATFFYRDEDGDKISITCTDDLKEGFRFAELQKAGLRILLETNSSSRPQEEAPPVVPERPREPVFDELGRPYHRGVTCDQCGRAISGIRYKCAECHDYDLCEECERTNQHPAEHVTLKIRIPTKVELYNPFPRRSPFPWGQGEERRGHCGRWRRHRDAQNGFPHGHGFWRGCAASSADSAADSSQSFHPSQSFQGQAEASPDVERPDVVYPSEPVQPTPTAQYMSRTIPIGVQTELAQPTHVAGPTLVPTPTPFRVPSAYESQLTVLQEMGFYDREQNIRALEQVNGRIELVVGQLLQMSL